MSPFTLRMSGSSLASLRIERGLADQQRLGLSCKDRRDAAKHQAYQDRSHPIQSGQVKGAGCPGTKESQASSDQCRAVLEQHHEGGRVLALAERLDVALLALVLADGAE